MTTRQALLNLAARVEGLDGPCREVDEEIQCTIHGATAEMQRHGHNAYHKNGRWISIGKILSCTASIDAAMTLVPEDCAPSVMRQHCGSGKADIHISPHGDMVYGSAATPSLALTTASLRARAAMMESEG